MSTIKGVDCILLTSLKITQKTEASGQSFTLIRLFIDLAEFVSMGAGGGGGGGEGERYSCNFLYHISFQLRKTNMPFELRRAMANVTSLDSFLRAMQSTDKGFMSSLRNAVRSLNNGRKSM